MTNTSGNAALHSTGHEALRFSLNFFNEEPEAQEHSIAHSLGWNLNSADIQTTALSTVCFLRHHSIHFSAT